MRTGSRESISVYGLGIIGGQAARHLAAAGHPLRTWSRSPRERPDFEPDPLVAAEHADILAVYLKDAPAVCEWFERIRPALDSNRTVLNHATVDLDTTAFLEGECAKAGCGFLNAPFTGSKVAAENGALVYYAGGDETLIERLRPVLEVTSKQVIPVGTPAAATVLKLTTNLITASTVQALAESLTLNLAFGNSAELLLEALGPNACSSVLATMKLPSMAGGDFDPHFSLSNMLKDGRYMLDLAERAGVQVPGIENTVSQMQNLADQGHGERDFSILYRQFASNP